MTDILDGSERSALEATLMACTMKVTRLEVIGGLPNKEVGRLVSAWDVDLAFSLQDDCQTLKIFLEPKRRSKEARDLKTKKYRQRVVPSKKIYSRKEKHKG